MISNPVFNNQTLKNITISALTTTACIIATKKLDNPEKSTTTPPSDVVKASVLASPFRSICASAISNVPKEVLPIKVLSSVGPTAVLSSVESVITQTVINNTPKLNKQEQTMLGASLATPLTLPFDVWSIITSQKSTPNPLLKVKNITIKNLPSIFSLASLRNGFWLTIAMTQRNKIEEIADKYSQKSSTKKEFLITGLTSLGATPAAICHVALCTTINQANKAESNYISPKEILSKTTANLITKPGLLAVTLRCLHAGAFSAILRTIQKNEKQI